MISKKHALLALALALPMAARGTAEQDAIVAELRRGNELFVSDAPGGLPALDSARRVELSTNGQHPKAIVLSCADSRVPPEHLFRQGLGEVFVARIAGNVAASGILATVEYGVEHLHVPVLVVLGHGKCGAVGAAVAQRTAPGGLTPDLQRLVREITPAVRIAETRRPADLLAESIEVNAFLAARRLVERSEVVRSAVERGELRIVVGIYDVDTGAVELHPLDGE